MSLLSLIDEALQDALDAAGISLDDVPAAAVARFYAAAYELSTAVNTATAREEVEE